MARSLVRRYVVNREVGVQRIFWNNLVAWHCFDGSCGGYFDRLGRVSSGELELETAADRRRPRLAWFADQKLAAETDEPDVERLGPVDAGHAAARAFGYRRRADGRTGFVPWSDLPPEGTTPAAVRVVSFITDAAGTPTRDEEVDATGGAVVVALDADPAWIEPR